MNEPLQPRLRLADRQIPLGDCTLDEAVPSDHTVRIVAAYVEHLDLSAFLATIRVVPGVHGRNATDPRLLLTLWMYATIDGVGSAREIIKLVEENLIYRWILGGVSMNHHTLSDFRNRHAQDLEDLMVRHVSALMHQGLITLQTVAQDGMKTRASAGSSSFHRATTLETAQQQVEQQIEALKQQPEEDSAAVSRRQTAARMRHAQEKQERLEAALEVAAQLQEKQQKRDHRNPSAAQKRKKKPESETAPRASSTDPDARRMKMGDGGTRPAFNVQVCTDVDTKLIVGIDVVNQGTDGGLAMPMLDQVEENYDRVPENLLVDGSDNSIADIEAAAEKEVAIYCPIRNEKKDLAAGKDPYQAKPKDSDAMKAYRQRMGTEAGKKLYRKRGETAEWVNAGMRNRGLYGFGVRGLAKVRTVVVIQALVHNLLETRRRCRENQNGWNWTEILRAVGSPVGSK